MSHLFLIRHGQASFLSDNYDQLSDMGREQAKILGKQLVTSATNFDVVYSGDLVRQIDTAEIVANVYLENEVILSNVALRYNAITDEIEHKETLN